MCTFSIWVLCWTFRLPRICEFLREFWGHVLSWRDFIAFSIDNFWGHPETLILVVRASPSELEYSCGPGARRRTKRPITRDPPTRLPAFWSCCLTASIDAPCRLGKSPCALVGARSRRRPIDHRSRKQHQHYPLVLAARSASLGSYQHREATDSFPRVAPVPRSEGAPSYPPPPGNGAGACSTRCSTTEADQAAMPRSCAVTYSADTTSSLQCTFSSTREPASRAATQSQLDSRVRTRRGAAA